MERIKFGTQEIEVDVEKTSAIYKRMLDSCQCDFCTNAHITRSRHTPAVQVEILNSLGVDPCRPCLSQSGGKHYHEPARHTHRLSCWFIYGRIVGEPTLPNKIRIDRWNRMWVDHKKDVMSVYDGAVADLEGDPDLLYIFASNVLPLLYGEVSGFRMDYGEKCIKCGSRFWETGYLKRRSLIPQWEGLPQLKSILLERKHRVYVMFCHSCGHMEHEIVPNKRPFRKRNTLYRDERKLKIASGIFGQPFVIVRGEAVHSYRALIARTIEASEDVH